MSDLSTNPGAAAQGGAVWAAWLAAAQNLDRRFQGHFVPRRFEFWVPTALQRAVPRRLRRSYAVPVACADWGPPDGPLVLCVGGIANTLMRFAFLAADLARAGYRVICLDWPGRGASGWLAHAGEYGQETWVELLCQLMVSLRAQRGGAPLSLLGSSLGGSVAMALAARHPDWISRLVLNDVGPHIPWARRARRAEVLARHYVFRTPDDLMRRCGASQKNDGPVSPEVRQFIAHHQTRWSAEEGGRIYRHDPRAMLAYHEEAQSSVDQWADWARLRCPILVLHGMQSDALLSPTWRRMQRSQPLMLAHVPDTGHTPVLADRHHTRFIQGWLDDPRPEAGECSLLHAQPRCGPENRYPRSSTAAMA